MSSYHQGEELGQEFRASRVEMNTSWRTLLKYSTAWNLRASEILLFYRNKCKSSAPILWMEAQSLGGREDGSAGERQDWWDSHAQFCLSPFTSTPPHCLVRTER